jgi:hypothetical protein
LGCNRAVCPSSGSKPDKRKEKKRKEKNRAFTDHFIILILRPAATDKEEVTLLQVRARPRQQEAENWREGTKPL